jgi:DNA-binding Lrp family transcriptional regulator
MEVPGESVVLVRVRPGQVDRALKELRKLEPVNRVETVLGPYDLVVTGAFRDSRSFQKFLQGIEEQDFCQGCEAQITLEGWKREREEKGPISAWTLIQASNPEKVMKELQKIPAVNRLYTTPGHFNVIANIAAPETSKLIKTLTDEIHRIHEIRRTETLSGVREEK